jgi:ABC-type multidrug transport system permease subunit
MDGYQSQAVDVSVAPGATLTNSDVVLQPNASTAYNWMWLVWVALIVLIVGAIVAAIAYSRNKKSRGTD